MCPTKYHVPSDSQQFYYFNIELRCSKEDGNEDKVKQLIQCMESFGFRTDHHRRAGFMVWEFTSNDVMEKWKIMEK